ncbi:DUF7091 family protein [Halalkalicoccus subterraneus]|uniref:DUF7091 family protein n=1 Tax=Halalkalicoccus subterraneus TaxID=2675002 RepID=UPI000EFBAEA9|nr:hypothetical protein [Halalkalicoccus subterraneus]
MVDRQVNRFIRSKLREAGRQYEQARSAYRDGRGSGSVDVPRDESDRARIVCRRYAEKRAVELDDDDRPTCYEDGHPDCEGCLEDLHNETIESW